jgi:7-keto-8-aminopelargonate synthetase-like enzyme
MPGRPDDKISQRLQAWRARVEAGKANDFYFYNQPIEELRGGARVFLKGREMLMFASYSYLGLIGHPKITAAAQAALARYGTGTHGVRLLAGSLSLHTELEDTIARFKGDRKSVV